MLSETEKRIIEHLKRQKMLLETINAEIDDLCSKIFQKYQNQKTERELVIESGRF